MDKGKLFELEIKHSLDYFKEKYPLYYIKLPDYRTFSRLNIQVPKMPCDFFLSLDGISCLLELKQTNSKHSFSLNNIRPHQYTALISHAKIGGHSYLLINRRSPQLKTFAIDIQSLLRLANTRKFRSGKLRKSILWDTFEAAAIQLERFKLKKNYYGWNLGPLFWRIFTQHRQR